MEKKFYPTQLGQTRKEIYEQVLERLEVLREDNDQFILPEGNLYEWYPQDHAVFTDQFFQAFMDKQEEFRDEYIEEGEDGPSMAWSDLGKWLARDIFKLTEVEDIENIEEPNLHPLDEDDEEIYVPY